MKNTTLIGAWKLIKCQSFDEDGNTHADILNDAEGLIIYTSNGLMSVQIMQTKLKQTQPEYENYPTQPPFDVIPDSVARASLQGYLAYYGTYTIDVNRNEVHHTLLGSNLPHYIGKCFKRNFEFMDDDNLILKTEINATVSSSAPMYRRLHWQRQTNGHSI